MKEVCDKIVVFTILEGTEDLLESSVDTHSQLIGVTKPTCQNVLKG